MCVSVYCSMCVCVCVCVCVPSETGASYDTGCDMFIKRPLDLQGLSTDRGQGSGYFLEQYGVP